MQDRTCVKSGLPEVAVPGVKDSQPGRTGVTVLPRGDTGGLRRAPAILQGW